MSSKSGMVISKPLPLLKKSIKADFKEFSKALGKASASLFLGNWDNLASEGVDALGALGLAAGTEEIAWLLTYRSLLQAMKQLVDERTKQDSEKFNYEELKTLIDQVLENIELSFNTDFFAQPEKIAILGVIKPIFVNWLEDSGLKTAEAASISERMPIYFAMALHEEWSRRPKDYAVLRENLDTPFTQANVRAQGWLRYTTWLRQHVDEPMFLEAFSLKQVFVPLRAYYERKLGEKHFSETEGRIPTTLESQRIVIDLQSELEKWIEKAEKDDAIRLVSGGPGSGKSSFAKIFAATLAEKGTIPVLFIPLHHFELSEDLIDAVGKFLRIDGLLQHNPLDTAQREARLLIIFDGLDELAMQGKIAEKAAQDFVREVQRKVERFNQQKITVQVLIGGRELVIQANETTFRKEGQILHVLPYFVSKTDRAKYIDPDNLLAQDQRQTWWQLYGKATGNSYVGLPNELDKENLAEITAQPLLNYLVALSLLRGQLKFSEETNLNVVYADLLKAIYERGWAGYQHIAIEGVEEKDFIRVLEEVALASWHGDGRTTTVKEITSHCNNSGLDNLLARFQSGLEKHTSTGVTKLLTAFYFRQSGQDISGERTFEFTHKSFGEYLTARRIFREIRLIHKKLEERRSDPDEGWGEREALYRWTLICGSSAIDSYLFNFVLDEARLQNLSHVANYQQSLCHLIEFMLRHGMPLERLNPRPDFQEENRLTRNAEESLLIVLNACARLTGVASKIKWKHRGTFGTWLSRLCEQRIHFGIQSISLECLSHLDLHGCSLISCDIYHANLNNSNLQAVSFVEADCRYANFNVANLERANFTNADLTGAILVRVNLKWADLEGANLEGANLENADLEGARLRDTNLEGAKLKGANLEGAKLRGASLEGAKLRGANLAGVNLDGVDLEGVNLEGVDFEDEDIEDEEFKGEEFESENHD
jgi:uncharacterized protein YjbI with pentapeptide repeats